jgi:hypothetical protein
MASKTLVLFDANNIILYLPWRYEKPSMASTNIRSLATGGILEKATCSYIPNSETIDRIDIH